MIGMEGTRTRIGKGVGQAGGKGGVTPAGWFMFLGRFGSWVGCVGVKIMCWCLGIKNRCGGALAAAVRVVVLVIGVGGNADGLRCYSDWSSLRGNVGSGSMWIRGMATSLDASESNGVGVGVQKSRADKAGRSIPLSSPLLSSLIMSPFVCGRQPEEWQLYGGETWSCSGLTFC